jgi:hypothetical protein
MVNSPVCGHLNPEQIDSPEAHTICGRVKQAGDIAVACSFNMASVFKCLHFVYFYQNVRGFCDKCNDVIDSVFSNNVNLLYCRNLVE